VDGRSLRRAHTGLPPTTLTCAIASRTSRGQHARRADGFRATENRTTLQSRVWQPRIENERLRLLEAARNALDAAFRKGAERPSHRSTCPSSGGMFGDLQALSLRDSGSVITESSLGEADTADQMSRGQREPTRRARASCGRRLAVRAQRSCGIRPRSRHRGLRTGKAAFQSPSARDAPAEIEPASAAGPAA
jgi:hypothetical protein